MFFQLCLLLQNIRQESWTKVTGVNCIVAELEELVRRFNIQYTGFPDDPFTLRGIVLEICALMREPTPGIKWLCRRRVNTLDREMLETMKDVTGFPTVLSRVVTSCWTG